MADQNLNPNVKSYDQIVHFLRAQVHAAIKNELEKQARAHEEKFARMKTTVEALRGFLKQAKSTASKLEEDNKALREANKRVEHHLAELAKVAYGVEEDSFDFHMAQMANHTAQAFAAGSYDDINSVQGSHDLMSDMITELNQEVGEDQKTKTIDRIDSMIRQCQKLMDEPSKPRTDFDSQG